MKEHSELIYRTRLGKAFCGDSLTVMRAIPASSVNLVITSPPFALRRKKSYGNVPPERYIGWFWPFAVEISRILKPNGSLVLDIGGSWNKREATRSLYHFELLLRLCDRDTGLFKLAQEFYWYNPAKMPAPAQWVTVRRIRVKDAVNPIWWLCRTPEPNACNRRVLVSYTESMQTLLQKGYNDGKRPSGHVVSKKWGKRQPGAIPPNIIIASNTSSNDPYLKGCRESDLVVHPARFPRQIPEFFVRFLTEPGDLVLDPFAGSNVVGAVAESLERRWVAAEIKREYIVGSAFRFEGLGASVVKEHREQGRGSPEATRNCMASGPENHC